MTKQIDGGGMTSELKSENEDGPSVAMVHVKLIKNENRKTPNGNQAKKVIPKLTKIQTRRKYTTRKSKGGNIIKNNQPRILKLLPKLENTEKASKIH